MKVRHIMHNTTVLGSTRTVLDAARVMSERNIGSVLVRGMESLGMLTERDILTKVVARNLVPDSLKVTEVMTRLDHTIDAECDVGDASEIFNKFHIRRLPVTEDSVIVGIITTRDVARTIYRSKLREMERYRREYTFRMR